MAKVTWEPAPGEVEDEEVVPAQDQESNRSYLARRGILRMPESALLEVCSLPEDFAVVGMVPDPVRNVLQVIVHHPDLPVVAEDCEPPVIHELTARPYSIAVVWMSRDGEPWKFLFPCTSVLLACATVDGIEGLVGVDRAEHWVELSDAERAELYEPHNAPPPDHPAWPHYELTVGANRWLVVEHRTILESAPEPAPAPAEEG